MNKKRIDRCDLNGLASKFEVISEIEKYKGQAYYYYPNGTFCGQFGDSPEVRILNDYSDVNNLLYNSDPNSINNQGSLFSQSNNTAAKTAIISCFLPSSYQGSIGTTVSQPGAAAQVSSGDFSYDPSHGSFNNYYNLQNVMVHETEHINQHQGGSTSPTQQREVAAITTATNHSSYVNTTDSYKTSLATQLWSNAQSLGYSKEWVSQVTGVPVSKF